MDTIDRKILMLLQSDAKQNTKEIARQVGLTVTPTYERIKKLEQQGIIKSYVALLERSKTDKQLITYCQITLLKHQKTLIDDFKRNVLSFNEIMECHHVSGNFDFLLKVATSNIGEFHHFINEKLSVAEGISTIHSSFVMNSIKESTAYVLR